MSLGITVRHHSASLVMPISDPRYRFFYSQHTPMKDTYYLPRSRDCFALLQILCEEKPRESNDRELSENFTKPCVKA